MHVVVILPRWVGDTVMATPLLRGLRAHLPAARITGVLRPVLVELLDGTGWLDDHIPYDRHAGRPDRGFAAAARALRGRRADVALVLPGSLSAAALAWAGGVRRRVGFGGSGRGLFLTDRLRHPELEPGDPRRAPPHVYLAVGGPLGVPPEPARVELAVTRADEIRGDALLAELFPHRGGPLVILNDNSANGSARSWGPQRHAALARWLVERVPEVRVLVHCGPGDREPARAIVSAADSPAVRGLGDVPDLPLGLSKALYRRAQLSVTSDSGPRHIGAAFGVPTVALIGPTEPLSGRSAPDSCIDIRLDLPCSPCSQSDCPLQHGDCMRLIDVERVSQAALRLLDGAARERVGRAG